jgi:hypothetical protein
METQRQMIFVSHANPEENEFARWLTLQLANAGYAVWCDQTRLLGGEKFWEDIQVAIKESTVKFLFVLTTAANQKRGTLDELDCAIGTEKRRGLKDFIIPLKLDDLAYDDTYISIRRLNQIDFRGSWAKGLAILLDKLSIDKVPTSPAFNPSAVADWWRSQTSLSASQGVVDMPDVHLSNWFTITGLPVTINRHFVTRREIGKIDFSTERFPYPAVKDSDVSFLSFATAADLMDALPQSHFIEDTDSTCSVKSILDRTAPRGYPNHLTRILRSAWERALAKTSLPAYELSSHAKCHYFVNGTVADNRLYFNGTSGKRERRDVIGYATRAGKKRYWHYGINAKPMLWPHPHLVVKGHVLFSDDGVRIWDNKEKIAKARRNQCKTWWNDEWRDRVLAVMTFLSDDSGQIQLPVSSELALTVGSVPELFESPVAYLDPDDLVKEEEMDDYDFEEPEAEDEIGPQEEESA